MDNFKKVVFYSHINSGNHGCEAIVKSTYDILSLENNENYYWSTDVELDKKCGVEQIGKLVKINEINGFKPFMSLPYRILRRLGIDKDGAWKYKFARHLSLLDENTLALSTGGDIYCYPESDWLTYLNREARKRGAVTVLWGCSIDEEWLTEEVIADLHNYSLITVRESITLETLHKAGIKDNVRLFPDPAFKLPKKELDIFPWSKMGKIVGINLSRHVVKNEKILKLFVEFLEYIIKDTPYSVVLIPHVFWESENDVNVLRQIYDEISNKEKLYIVDREYTCNEFKYIISKCNIFMGARTHSVIAAYSSCVPAFAFSYSKKSRGIAKDIFGKEDGYVAKIDENTQIHDLVHIFDHLSKRELEIKNHLIEFIPQYTSQIDEEKGVIEELRKKDLEGRIRNNE